MTINDIIGGMLSVPCDLRRTNRTNRDGYAEMPVVTDRYINAIKVFLSLKSKLGFTIVYCYMTHS